MLWKIFSYIYYKLTAKGRHGIHSPFVYKFVDKCLKYQIPKSTLKSYNTYFKLLKLNSTLITINDQGAGSKKLSNQRKISDIAQISGTRNKYGRLLYKISAHYSPKNTLELGTSLGLGTFMLATGFPEGKVTTIDACQNTQSIAKKQLTSFGLKNINFINSTFKEFIKKDTTVYNLIFIDGDHRGEKLLELLNLLEKNSNEETLFILDDIRWTKDMYEAWKKVVEDTKYHLTMDLFRIGIIAKRYHQRKEHFTIYN